MKHLHLPVGLAFLLLSASGFQPASAELPMINQTPWLGHFAVFANKRFQFAVTAQGKITLIPIGDNDKPVANSLEIPVEISVEEIRPDGKITVKTLESAQPANRKFENAVLRGKVTGEASFELTLEQARGVISLGGRLLDPGTLTKNPLRFSILIKFPSAYRSDNRRDKREQKAFEKKTGDDRLDLTWIDGKRKKQAFTEKVDASSKALGGPGIAAAEVEISSYKGRKFEFIASRNSTLALANEKGPLHEGFEIRWLPDPAKDPQGKARLSLEVR
jgi:hypothetical protein